MSGACVCEREGGRGHGIRDIEIGDALKEEQKRRWLGKEKGKPRIRKVLKDERGMEREGVERRRD